MSKFTSDIDIDFGDRDLILKHLAHTPAAMRNIEKPRKHNTGIHVTSIPYDPVHDMASLDYTEAEQRGYIKLDMLNVHVYRHVRDETHLIEMMGEPRWDMLKDEKLVEQMIHVGSHFDTLKQMPEPVNSIPRLAMFIAIIRPGKRHLIGKPWLEVAETIWDASYDEGYSFKKAHAIAYAHLVVVHMNLIATGSTELFSLE
jgi:hypothetical protein